MTVGAGLLHFALRRSHNIHWQDVKVDKSALAGLNSHAPAVIWFTGLSGSGKSTIADIVESKLHAQGVHTYLLDGDNVRHGPPSTRPTKRLNRRSCGSTRAR